MNSAIRIVSRFQDLDDVDFASMENDKPLFWSASENKVQSGDVSVQASEIEGLDDVLNLYLTVDNYNSHVGNLSNPHGVTKIQVGLSNVIDSLQLVASNNLSDLPDPVQARSNLGLGSASTRDATDFATSSHDHLLADISGVGSIASQDSDDVNISGGSVEGLENLSSNTIKLGGRKSYKIVSTETSGLVSDTAFQISPDTNCSCWVTFKVIGVSSDGSSTCAFSRDYVLTNYNGSLNLNPLGGSIDYRVGFSGTSINANISGSNLNLMVFGQSGEVIKWSCFLEYQYTTMD